MDAIKFNEYMKDQIEEIEKDKWIESEKSGYDLGEERIKFWVKTYSKDFRKDWEEKHGEI